MVEISLVDTEFWSNDWCPGQALLYPTDRPEFIYPGLVFVFKDDLPAAGVFFGFDPFLVDLPLEDFDLGFILKRHLLD